ncbi:prolipoprotein diacylglyceryl transferase [Candidatus Woesearchaeota archaeon]|nr:prolipoprotein diacylglyceryl transferase [Candidatus Woesearchaeota archaeon]
MTWTHNLNPVALDIGFFQIRWYGIMYVIGYLLVSYWLNKAAKEQTISIDKKATEDILFWLTIAIVAGARLGYVLFYNLSHYVNNPLSIIAVWQGGMSFHGGLAGGIIATYIMSKKHKTGFFKLASILITPLALGHSLGRIGNFINGELFGKITTLPWGIIFPGVEGARHPTQLYEAGTSFLIFIILYSIKERKLPVFMILYSIARFSIEFLREPDPQLGMIGPLSMGQWLTIPVLAIGIYLWTKEINKRTLNQNT